MRYLINDRNHLAEKRTELFHLMNMRRYNVNICQKRSLNGPADFQSYQILAIQALRTINIKEALYCE